MRNTLKKQLYNHIKNNRRVSSEGIYALCLSLGYRHSNAERRLRELKEDLLIEVEIKKSARGSNYISGYCLPRDYKPEPKRVWVDVTLPSGEIAAKLVEV